MKEIKKKERNYFVSISFTVFGYLLLSVPLLISLIASFTNPHFYTAAVSV
jgi:hypothetical protein